MGEEEYGSKPEEPKYETDPKTGAYLYTDPKTKIEYIWDTAKNSWVKKDEKEDTNARILALSC